MGAAMPFDTWYAILCVIAVVDVLLFAYSWVRRAPSPETRYTIWMKWLALPWVFECVWRCVFPALYLQRFVVWDTPLNAVLVDRTLACLGELAWTAQIALAVVEIDFMLVQRAQHAGERGGTKRTMWICVCGVMSVLIYVAAECMSFYNTATENEWWAAAEVITDGVAFAFFFPACVSLFGRQWHDPWCKPKIFALVVALTAVVYPLYNWLVDAKMYLKRYDYDQSHNKTYFKFIPGLEDAAVHRVVTHKTVDWSEDMVWMIVYFSVAAWSGIWLMAPPIVESRAGAPLLLKYQQGQNANIGSSSGHQHLRV